MNVDLELLGKSRSSVMNVDLELFGKSEYENVCAFRFCRYNCLIREVGLGGKASFVLDIYYIFIFILHGLINTKVNLRGEIDTNAHVFVLMVIL
jgi:hypothetical protein